ncbi:hypothetical protein [Flavobacterium sp. J27]|uniref:hypothetical protein n=1 Tax=Flavobacterium sp. J27 TaxID=2060419 RepID=UPI00102F88F5|nr:hypothetical protein [Flavobacterium sp. J27]
MAQVTVKGKNSIDEIKRVKSIEKLNILSTDELERLTSLSDNKKAREYLSSPTKFAILKNFL